MQSKQSPLMGGGNKSFMERRRQMLQAKQQNPCGPMITVGTLESQSLHTTPIKKPSSEFGGGIIKLGEDSASFGSNLAPLNTKKTDDPSNQQERMQCTYKFFLSLNTTSFEEAGVTAVCKAVENVSAFTERGCKVHFTVLSSNKCFDRLRDLKKKHLGFAERVSYEITPHHMLFTDRDIKDKEVIMKCSPPIRDEKERYLFVLSLQKHYFDSIASGHFPVAPMYKNSVGGNFFKAFNGVSTLGFTLQSLWTIFKTKQEFFNSSNIDRVVNEDKFLQAVVHSCCQKPAQILGLEKYKGSIEKGKHADLVVFNPEAVWTVGEEDVKSRYHEVSIYKGRELHGQVVATFLRGEKSFGGEESAKGKLLKRRDFV